MKKSLALILILTSITSFAGTIEWGVASLNHTGDGIYGFTIATPSGSISMNLTGAYSDERNAFVFENNVKVITAGYSAFLFQTTEGMLIDHDLIFNSSDLFFLKEGNSGAMKSETTLEIAFASTVVLAFAVGNYDYIPPDYATTDYVVDWYGWIEFGYNEKDGVYIVNSAASGTGDMGGGIGVFAGTGIMIPEPSTSLLALSGLALLFRRRRRK